MIGIIGPEDSIRLVQEVAAGEGRAEAVSTRVYTRPEQAPELARELDEVCQVLLFTGRIPYAFASAAGELRAEIDYVPHAGIDLYRTLSRMLLATGGKLPRVSVDTIDAETVRETYHDIEVAPPTEILPIADSSGLLFTGLDEITAYHRERYASGAVEACLTCLGAVHRDLADSGVPVWRVEHTRASVRDALRRAWLAAEVRQSRATQIAVMMVDLGVPTTRAQDPYQAERQRLRVREALLEHAERMRGRLATVDDRTLLITTTRGTVESAIARHRDGHASLLTLRGVDVEHAVGFGAGTTIAAAEDNARKALALGRHSGDTHVVFPDGEVYSSRETAVRPRLRETAPGVLRVSEQLRIGPLSTRRLLEALHQMDPDEVTARGLADAYGVEARSARRLLKALRAAGFAEEVGLHVSTGAGRPQTVYRVAMRRLLGAIGAEA
ncbi:hypothetical protein C5N14_26455 [Micromonospora sp. MW-13]|uniref:hypothetical protein n=1 Tax=unclassified Micromonospora TaxID=2617518 RepID=UPI000E44EA47|nr:MULTISPECIES: hypothetical protein [unclassified Micromonospora]MCX4471899.1 hypothetical protein [Micromonospora sp. NBC_01655]RGC65897.1 hypothetical protein C5N14_26455 [Micromonospora sp. MW-13]